MSRVGKKPVSIPDKIKIVYQDRVLTVEGNKGINERSIHPAVDLKIENNLLSVVLLANDKRSRAIQGLTRSLVANMITGVNNGFERILEINGIGYRASIQEKKIIFNLGYSHPIDFDLPEGIVASIEKNTIIKLTGVNKEKLGHTAAAIRKLRPPEPYKGKGVKYAEERIRRKAGKTGTK